MHAVALRALRTAQGPLSRSACRIVGGCRHPLPRRTFHRSAFLYRTPETPSEKDIEGKETPGANPEAESEESRGEDEGTTSSGLSPEIEDLTLTVRRGPKSTRIQRARQRQIPEGLPPLALPEWFWQNNVRCFGDPELSGSLAVFGEGHGLESDLEIQQEISRQKEDIKNCRLASTESARYSIHVDVYREILSSLRAGLVLRPPKNSGALKIIRPPIVLACPKDGGAYYLDSVVESVATKLEADLIRIDAQDLAQVVGPYVDENLAWSRVETSLLGYEAQKLSGKLEEFDKDTNGEQGEEGAEDEDDPLGRAMGNFRRSLDSTPGNRSQGGFPPLSNLFSQLNLKPGSPRINTWIMANGMVSNSTLGNPNLDPRQQQSATSGANISDQWNDLKITTVLEAIINAVETKRMDSIDSDSAESVDLEIKPRGLIVQIKDYQELIHTKGGDDLVRRLRNIINKKWQEGKSIMCVGTTSSEEAELVPALSRPEIQSLQSDIVEGEKRTIYVPPDRREEQDTAFESDEKARIRRINIRHIEDMIFKLGEGTPHLKPTVNIEKDLDSATVFSAGLEDAVWKFSTVHRLATTILGLENSLETVDGLVFANALKVLAASDQAKFSWGAAELKKEDDEVEEMLKEENESPQAKSKKKLQEIRKKCNPHEKKLLSGVISPADLKTTFDDVQAPKETIEALRTLTSLSLIRPDAFSYGVLATDKIPGLLLYGPPGTGKTLLAKAVAKESAATMLEISMADMNDMYVGEGEKNVKALFSLAKKLSPCVVFIDEADALFSQRGDSRRTAHRELINQFLREWDGMNNLSAFIMVATNRPFDLDEAVLRRLPRRLLVDLPIEKEREAILKIHLKDEILDESVSLARLAKDTPFYSGSDLKNLSVAAALACIREENEEAAKHTGEDLYEYPEKRTLMSRHFDKALEEISASVSEDMSTLTAIRKFDEKYGDRKGRRKKGPGLGFGGTKVVEKDSEAARVRKAEV